MAGYDEGLIGGQLSEHECSPGEEPIANNDVESIERPPWHKE